MFVKEQRFTKKKLLTAAIVIVCVAIAVLAFMLIINRVAADDGVVAEIPVRNLVDERIELINLLDRLAEVHWADFRPRARNYQIRQDDTFGEFAHHPAVLAMHNRTIFSSYQIALRLEISDGGVVLNQDFYNAMDTHTRRVLSELAQYINDFYVETGFGAFFKEHEEYFMQRSQNFMENVYVLLNFEWFSQFGLYPENMRIVVAPANSYFAFAAWYSERH